MVSNGGVNCSVPLFVCNETLFSCLKSPLDNCVCLSNNYNCIESAACQSPQTLVTCSDYARWLRCVDAPCPQMDGVDETPNAGWIAALVVCCISAAVFIGILLYVAWQRGFCRSVIRASTRRGIKLPSKIVRFAMDPNVQLSPPKDVEPPDTIVVTREQMMAHMRRSSSPDARGFHCPSETIQEAITQGLEAELSAKRLQLDAAVTKSGVSEATIDILRQRVLEVLEAEREKMALEFAVGQGAAREMSSSAGNMHMPQRHRPGDAIFPAPRASTAAVTSPELVSRRRQVDEQRQSPLSPRVPIQNPINALFSHSTPSAAASQFFTTSRSAHVKQREDDHIPLDHRSRREHRYSDNTGSTGVQFHSGSDDAPSPMYVPRSGARQHNKPPPTAAPLRIGMTRLRWTHDGEIELFDGDSY